MGSYDPPSTLAPVVEVQKYKKRKNRAHGASTIVLIVSGVVWVAMFVANLLLNQWMDMTFSLLLFLVCVLVLVCKWTPKRRPWAHLVFLALHCAHIVYIATEILVVYVREFHNTEAAFSAERSDPTATHTPRSLKLVALDLVKVVFIVVRVIFNFVIYVDFRYLHELYSDS
ncbi:hypothetical protein M3Y99_00636800 [Aphelenchoides fujianensis]|nr:hypothetical protein M3Y99_00636800 [Aphelenchoides fujianensis]